MGLCRFATCVKGVVGSQLRARADASGVCSQFTRVQL